MCVCMSCSCMQAPLSLTFDQSVYGIIVYLHGVFVQATFVIITSLSLSLSLSSSLSLPYLPPSHDDSAMLLYLLDTCTGFFLDLSSHFSITLLFLLTFSRSASVSFYLSVSLCHPPPPPPSLSLSLSLSFSFTVSLSLPYFVCLFFFHSACKSYYQTVHVYVYY